ncbi:hypothetical protein GYMLUDRAFT_39762, partial [Collybiopsis luxurians FD-317 M1]
MSKQYPFAMCFMRGPESQWPDKIKEGIFEAVGETKEEAEKKYAKFTYQAGLDDMETFLADAQAKGKTCVIKEHTVLAFKSELVNSYVSFSRKETGPEIVDCKLDVTSSEVEPYLPSPPFPNPTLLPDRLVATMSPVIIIRHPMFVFPSWARVCSTFGQTVFDKEFGVIGSLRWQRIMYEFYRAYYDKIDPEGRKDWPIVIDGDKLVEDTQGQMQKFCSLVGLAESEIQYSWEASDRFPDRVMDAFRGTIKGSTGVIRGLRMLGRFGA